jgi:hypothetical protein
MLRTFSEFETCAIGAIDGDIGRTSDLYFDDHTWVVRYLLVDTGTWLAGRTVLVSPMSIRQPDWATRRLLTDITREQVANSPDIDTDPAVSRQNEVNFLGYYGYPSYWGGTGLWGGAMTPRTPLPDAADPTSAHTDDPHLRSCDALKGYHLSASDGEIGHVAGFLVDDETWAIRYLIVNTSNWWLGHKVLIAPSWITGVHWSQCTVSVNVNRQAVKTAPPYSPIELMDLQLDAQLHAHYGHISNSDSNTNSNSNGTRQ